MTQPSSETRHTPLVLLVDDSRTLRAIERGILSEIGFRTIEAADGREALARLDEYPEVELILMDWNMPNMNGLECLHACRQRFDRRELKIMMVTTEIEFSQVARAMESGADEYLMKPFTKADLIAKLTWLGFDTGTEV